MRRILPLGCLVFFGSAAFAQTQPDIAEILKKVTETYRGVRQYELDSTLTFHNPSTGKDSAGSMRVVFKAPNKYRVEMKGGSLLSAATDANSSGAQEMLSVYDGATLWNYDPKANEYRSWQKPNLPKESTPEDIDIFAGIGFYRRAAQVFPNARFLRRESIATVAGNVECFVIDVGKFGAPNFLFIDQKTYQVLRTNGPSSDARMGVVFTTIKLDQPVADDDFKFEPPPDARRVE